MRASSYSKMSSNSKYFLWSRPENVPFPTVWDEFEAKESKDSDKLVKYRIQDLPEDRIDDAVQHLKDHLLGDEPLAVFYGSYYLAPSRFQTFIEMFSSDGINNQDYVDDYVRLWQAAFEQKLTIACFREGSDEIVALNLLAINSVGDPFREVIGEQVISSFIMSIRTALWINITNNFQSKSKGFNEILKMCDICYANFSPFEKYGADEYMGSLGLSVDRKYRELNSGTRLLKIRWGDDDNRDMEFDRNNLQFSFFLQRDRIAAPFGIKFTQTVFSSDFSNANADKAGFHLDVIVAYDEFNDINPELKNVKSKGMAVKTLVF